MGKTNGFLSFASTLPTKQSCIEYFEQIRWNGKVVSPFDETSKVYKYKNGKYRCANKGKYFDVKTGTLFAHTKLPLRCWFYAMFLFLSHKRGVSSCQLARDLGVTQKKLRGEYYTKSVSIWIARTTISCARRWR